MYERIKRMPSYRIIALFAGFLFLSTALSVTLSSSTHAAPLSLGETVQAVTNNVPIVKNVVPLLIPSQTTTPQQTAPATSNTTQTPTQQTSPSSTTTNAVEATQAETTQTAQVPSQQSVATGETASAVPSLAGNGLSVTAKEAQIASAIPHVTSPAITYGTNALNGKTAGAIILVSLAAIAGGAYVLYAYRPSLFARR